MKIDKNLTDNIFSILNRRHFHREENKKFDYVDLSISGFYRVDDLPIFYKKVLFLYNNFCLFCIVLPLKCLNAVWIIEDSDTNDTFSKDVRIRYTDNYARHTLLFHSGVHCTY